MRRSLVLLAALLALVPAGTAEAPAPDASKLRLAFSDLDCADATIAQRWEGARAEAMARDLDARWGDGDGELSTEEAAVAAREVERDLQGAKLDDVKLDGASAVVAHARADYVGDASALELRVSLELLLSPGPGGHVLVLAPRWASTVVLLPPEGWYADTTDGREATVVHASRDHPEEVYFLPAGIPTVTVQAPPAAVVDVRTVVMGASAAGLLGIVVFAGVRRRAPG